MGITRTALLALAVWIAMEAPAMAKLWEGKIYITGVPSPITVRAEAASPGAAKRIIESQYAGKFKRWSKLPHKVAKE